MLLIYTASLPDYISAEVSGVYSVYLYKKSNSLANLFTIFKSTLKIVNLIEAETLENSTENQLNCYVWRLPHQRLIYINFNNQCLLIFYEIFESTNVSQNTLSSRWIILTSYYNFNYAINCCMAYCFDPTIGL